MTVTDHDHDLLPEPEPDPATKGRRRPAVLLTALSVVALLGAGGFALAYLMPESNTPEDAVRELVTAITDEDLLGALDAVAPSERDLLKDTVVDIADELRRLELIDEDTDLAGIDGVDLGIDDLTLSAKELGDGVSLVDIRGTARFSVDPASLPVGSFVEEQSGGGGSSLGEAASSSAPIEGLQLVAIEEDGRWYVSLFYSLADFARREAGEPVPDFGNGVVADGADSPEGAVRAMVDAAGGLDARRAIALLPPDEARSLQDYAPLFLDDLEAAADEARDSFSLEVTDLELSAKKHGDDEAAVTVERFAVDASYEGEEGSFSFDGRCVTVVADGDEQRTCGGPGGLPTGLAVPFTGLFGLQSDEAEDGEDAGGDEPANLAIVTVRRDGKWYVSPIRTVLRPVVEALRKLEPEDLEGLLEGFGGSTERVEAIGSTSTLSAMASEPVAQRDLRNALTAFKVAFTDAGAWTDDVDEFRKIEPAVSLLPYEGFVLPSAVFYEVDGGTLRLAARSSTGCLYLADDQTTITYARDPSCGSFEEQVFGPSW